MRISKTKFLPLLFISFFFTSNSLFFNHTVLAQAVPNVGINLAVSPVFINLTTDPGHEVSSQFTVINNNNFSEKLTVSISRFSSNNDGANLEIVPVAANDEFSTWISFSETEFSVDANQSKKIKFTITPPSDSALGYYYAIVVKRTNDQIDTKQTSVTGAAAIPLLLEVRSPNAKRELQLTNFKTDHGFYEYLPVTFSHTVKNTGNIHIIPSGDIFIDQGSKKDVDIIHANPGRSNILPASTRVFTTFWDDAFIVNGKPWDFTKANKFRIGKYTAHLLLVYDNGKRDIPLEAATSFWVVPWRLILAAIAIIVGPALVVYIIMKLRYRK